MSARVPDTVAGIVEQGGDADDVLRRVVAALAAEPSLTWAGISFSEGGGLVPGPAAGTPDETRRRRVPVVFQGAVVGELAVDGEAEQAALERIAALVCAHVLLGWDTGGEGWEP